MKVKVNLSLEQDTAETLKELAQFSHKTVSQWVTDKIWEEKKKEEKEADKKKGKDNGK